MNDNEELMLELDDNEWPFLGDDHDRMIVRAIVYDGGGMFYFVHVSRDDDFGKATLIETSGGGVEKGEELRAALRRELREELGAQVEIIRRIGVVSDHYNLIRRHNINNYFLCRAVSFGERHLTEDEVNSFHLSVLRLTYDEAVKEYEACACTRLGQLIAQRELPVLRRAKELIDAMPKRKAELVTERLVLKSLGGEDMERMLSMMRDERVSATYMVPDLADEAAAQPFYKRLQALSEDQNRFIFGIYLGSELIGFLNDCGGDRECIELGYFIAPEQWGRGYAPEALSAAIEELFRLGFSRVKAGYFEENTASRRVMEKCGMAPLDEEDSVEYRGRTHRCLFMGVSADETARYRDSTKRR